MKKGGKKRHRHAATQTLHVYNNMPIIAGPFSLCSAHQKAITTNALHKAGKMQQGRPLARPFPTLLVNLPGPFPNYLEICLTPAFSTISRRAKALVRRFPNTFSIAGPSPGPSTLSFTGPALEWRRPSLFSEPRVCLPDSSTATSTAQQAVARRGTSRVSVGLQEGIGG